MRRNLQSPRQLSVSGSTIHEGGQAGITQISTSQWQISRIPTANQSGITSVAIVHQSASPVGMKVFRLSVSPP